MGESFWRFRPDRAGVKRLAIQGRFKNGLLFDERTQLLHKLIKNRCFYSLERHTQKFQECRQDFVEILEALVR